jgi:hypothetical protein
VFGQASGCITSSPTPIGPTQNTVFAASLITVVAESLADILRDLHLCPDIFIFGRRAIFSNRIDNFLIRSPGTLSIGGVIRVSERGPYWVFQETAQIHSTWGRLAAFRSVFRTLGPEKLAHPEKLCPIIPFNILNSPMSAFWCRWLFEIAERHLSQSSGAMKSRQDWTTSSSRITDTVAVRCHWSIQTILPNLSKTSARERDQSILLEFLNAVGAVSSQKSHPLAQKHWALRELAVEISWNWPNGYGY